MVRVCVGPASMIRRDAYSHRRCIVVQPMLRCTAVHHPFQHCSSLYTAAMPATNTHCLFAVAHPLQLTRSPCLPLPCVSPALLPPLPCPPAFVPPALLSLCLCCVPCCAAPCCAATSVWPLVLPRTPVRIHLHMHLHTYTLRPAPRWFLWPWWRQTPT